MMVSSEELRSVPLLDSLKDVEFVCPACRGELSFFDAAFSCIECKRNFQCYGGIPDFRVFGDPFLDFDEDFNRADRVLEVLDQHDLKSLLEYYWSLSDITPKHLRPKFVQSAMLGEARADQILRAINDGRFSETIEGKRFLEIGSGTGNLLVAGMRRGLQVIGVDIAMRWLHVSRRRCMDHGLPTPPLVCCCAERLPFKDRSFDLCSIASTLEFVREPDSALAEAARMTGPQGSVLVQTVNRYSIARDPYSNLWGVGFLPRRWQAKYVKLRCGATYDHTRLLSYRELNVLAKRFFESVEFAHADIEDHVLATLPWSTRSQVQLYRLAKQVPGISHLLKRIGPGWLAKFRRNETLG